MIDVTQQIDAVRRTVGTRVLEAGEARVVTVARTLDGPLEDVWDACTNPERVPRWFLPVSGELRPGGRYQLEGNASGTIERCDPPRSFAATWEYGDEVSWIVLQLTPTPDGRTSFELEHIAHVDDERWLQYGPGAVGVGWDLALIGLGLHLATGRAVDRSAAEAWTTSPEGARFMTESSERWRQASVDAGTPADEALAAAERTSGFYTGSPVS
jgi:uncharacterized protein YndB with AHSA1/START domain